jgi:hypothetical protein
MRPYIDGLSTLPESSASKDEAEYLKHSLIGAEIDLKMRHLRKAFFSFRFTYHGANKRLYPPKLGSL